MRIAQVSPLIESVPPQLYGGTERIVSYLTETLVAEGHDVTLFASADSDTGAQLIRCCEKALRLGGVADTLPYYMTMMGELRRRADEFDIIHCHIDQYHFPLFEDRRHQTLTTLHGRQDLPDLQHLYAGFPGMRLVSISNAQREPIAGAGFEATVYHGLPQNLFSPTLVPRGGYLAFLGRISAEKRVDRAIAIARAVGIPLRIAAKVDRPDEAYFHKEIVPLLSLPGIDFIGEIGDSEKQDFLGNASALLFPIDWPEPFGLVMIEAMACGTPVLAFRRGSVAEVVDEGITGYVVDNLEQAIRSLGATLALDRARVRTRFEQRFTARRMAEDYLRIYRKMCREAEHELSARRTNSYAVGSPVVAENGQRSEKLLG